MDLLITRETANDNIDVEDIIVTENTGTTSDHFLVGFTVPLCPFQHSTRLVLQRMLGSYQKLILMLLKMTRKNFHQILKMYPH